MLTNEQWTFDIINEFIYQFQAFCQFRTDLTRREPDEIEVHRPHLLSLPLSFSSPNLS